jgi:hypothetical protein
MPRRKFTDVEVIGDVCVALLPNGKSAFFDSREVELASGFPWSSSNGYVATRINGIKDYAHRIVVRKYFGEIPKDKVVDHINRDKTDNRISNLRVVSTHENNCNVKPFKGRGYRGVCWQPDRQRWYAYLKVDGKTRSLGRHKTFEDAIRAYNEAVIAHRSVYVLNTAYPE